ncbi:MAG: hypothetical protein ACI808_001147 [Paraglaciecola sp.]|jgi:hypothetical protein
MKKLMPAFTQKQLDFFKASSGAFSVVTNREATGDKSVTIDKYEKAVLAKCYPLDSFTRAGGALPDGKPTHFNFKFVFADGISLKTEIHKIAIKYPKLAKTELRLYFNRESHFYPPSNVIWYIFQREDDPIPHIGFMKSSQWDSIGLKKSVQEIFKHDYTFDEDDDTYQKSIAEPEIAGKAKSLIVTRHNRDTQTAKKALINARYKCEFDEEHQTFTSGSTQNNYVEAHHLVPVSLTNTSEFKFKLDVIENLIALCPNCHRAIHYGDAATKMEILTKLFTERHEKLNERGIEITLEQIFTIYGIG